jgi:ABC-type sugar transport system ATPase subunit
VSENEQLLLSVERVTKKFGWFSALKGVSFDLRAGEIHALFGANGAGKSTLAKVICGHHMPTEGVLNFKGMPVQFSRPRDAMEAGIGIVTQETSLAGDLPVWENIILPFYGGRTKVSRADLRELASNALAKLGFATEISIDRNCTELSSAHRQLVEIARIVALGSEVIILDEPTAALSPGESARLFKVMDALRSDGHGLIFVSHRLEEIFAMTDRITVLRDGQSVSSNLKTSDLTQAELIHHMVGRAIETLKAEDVPDTSSNDIVLDLRDVQAAPMVRSATLQIRSGEIVGLGGLVGSGRSELAEVLMGTRSFQAGHIELVGKPYFPTSSRAAIEAGLGFLPEDRRRQSIIPDFSVRENILLSSLSQQRGIRLQYGEFARRVNDLADLIALARDRLDDTSLLNFSGGMQQKALIIRALLLKPKILILDEPTKGVDVGSRATIYTLLRRLAADGMAILLISSDFEELLALSHRIVPISDGRTIGSVSASGINEEQLTLICAPRSSLDRQEQLLAKIAKRFALQASWVVQAGAQTLFLSRQGEIDGPAMPKSGSVVLKRDTAIAQALIGERGIVHTEANGSQSLIYTVENKRGLGLGGVAVLSSANAGSLNHKLIREAVASYLSEFEEGQLRLRDTGKCA